MSFEEDESKLNRIEELKRKLFSNNYQVKLDHRDSFAHTHHQEIPDSWQSNMRDRVSAGKEKFYEENSVFKKFFFFSLLFFFLAAAYALYIFWGGGNTVSKDNIDIAISGNAFVSGGEELPLIISITNKNTSALDLVDLVVEYPKSATKDLITASTPMERMRRSLGTIPSGAVRNEDLKLVLFGEQGSVVPIKFSLEYRVEGSNAIFVTGKIYEVSINSTPINLSINAPQSISPNQDVTLNIKASLNSTNPLTGVMIKVDYPIGFKFSSSSPSPTLGDNIWYLGDLAPGSEKNITLTGQMIDVFEGESKTFRVWGGTQSKTDKTALDLVFNSATQAINVSKPFVETRLSINGQTTRDYSIEAKSAIRGEIFWQNNLNTKITDLEIRAKLSGNALDRKTINALQGFYDSTTDTIIWNKGSVPGFAQVGPGDSGTVSFSLSSLGLSTASGGVLSNPLVNISVDLSGRQDIEGFNTKALTNSVSGVVHIISDLGFANKALYFSGPFKNTGSIPPKVGTETTYTIVWTVSNSANNISRAKIVSAIPEWMRFVGTVSPSSADLVYNPSTREITWNIGNISRGVGLSGSSKEVAFQVLLQPSLSQLNTVPILINQSALTGHDDFANVDVRVVRSALDAKLLNDPAFPNGGGVVSE